MEKYRTRFDHSDAVFFYVLSLQTSNSLIDLIKSEALWKDLEDQIEQNMHPIIKNETISGNYRLHRKKHKKISLNNEGNSFLIKRI